MPTPSFDDRYLKEAERRALLEGRVSEAAELDRELSDIADRGLAYEQEQQLIVAARDGDPDKFAELARSYGKRVYMVCYRCVGNREEANQLAQDTWLKVWKTHARLDPEGNFGAYVARVAMNLCNDLWRQQKRKGSLAWDQMESTDAVVEDDEGGGALLIDGIADPTAVDPEFHATFTLAFEGALKRLSDMHRDVFLLRFVLGYSRAEIAALKECTEQTVGNHEREARGLFSEYFLEEWGQVHV
jgi:RNA polymerase sigma-70 factor (ECF subfamily)